MLFQGWVDVTTSALQSLWENFILFVPNLLGAVIVLLVGWIFAVGLDKLVIKIIDILKVDMLLEKLGVGKLVSKAGLKLSSGKFLGFIAKWFIIFGCLMAASDILGLASVGFFLKGILLYVPNIVAAMIILLVTVWLADFLQRLVQASVMSATNVKKVGLLGLVTRWTVLIFGLLAALNQLGIAPMLIQSLITGLIAMLAIAGGLAFGLGSKEHASELIGKIKRELLD